jgi:hypothetical protein
VTATDADLGPVVLVLILVSRTQSQLLDLWRISLAHVLPEHLQTDSSCLTGYSKHFAAHMCSRGAILTDELLVCTLCITDIYTCLKLRLFWRPSHVSTTNLLE